jgi:hypothetical protein
VQPVRSIGELPFAARGLHDLLHLGEERTDINWDYTGFGHARAGAIWLESADGRQRRVDDALVLGLHNMEDGERLADDVELEFCIDEVAPGYSVSALLSKFWEIWAPRLRGDERAIVLALCNPQAARLHLPADVPVHYALGKVSAWHEPEAGRVLLAADTWLVSH